MGPNREPRNRPRQYHEENRLQQRRMEQLDIDVWKERKRQEERKGGREGKKKKKKRKKEGIQTQTLHYHKN